VSDVMVAQPEGSPLLIPKLTAGHDPDPVPRTFHPQNLFH